MSSTIFEVVLKPDEDLRRLVRRSGILLAGLGVLLILLMPLDSAWGALATVTWLLHCFAEQRNLRSAAARLGSLSLRANGTAFATDPAGGRHQLVLVSGCVVLPGIAWFRLRFSDGTCLPELFTRKRSGQVAWHRLQLLWQQAHGTFGHPPGP